MALSLTSLQQRDGTRYLINLMDLQARRTAEERFRLVVEAAPNAIILVDLRGSIVMVNRQAEHMFGYSRQELLGATVERLLPEALREAHVGLREGFQRNPEPRRMGNNRELFGQHRDGHMIPSRSACRRSAAAARPGCRRWSSTSASARPPSSACVTRPSN